MRKITKIVGAVAVLLMICVTANAISSVNQGFMAGWFAGDGGNITGLNAGNIATGTLADARLSTNITRTVVSPNSIQSAIDTANPPSTIIAIGSFTLSSPITLRSNIVLDLSQAILYSPVNNYAITASNVNNTHIFGGVIYQRDTTKSGIYLNTFSLGSVEGVEVHNGYRSIMIDSVSNANSILNNRVYDDHDIGIMLQDGAGGCLNNIIDGNYIQNATVHAINIYGSSCNIINNNIVNGTSSNMGIAVSGISAGVPAHDIVINGNNIYNTNREGIWAGSYTHHIVTTNNIVRNVLNDIGIDYDSSTDGIISGNMIWNTDKTCIALADSSGVTGYNFSITNNVAIGCGAITGELDGKGGHGIYVTNLINSTINGNTLAGGYAGAYGIVTGGTASGLVINNNNVRNFSSAYVTADPTFQSIVMKNDLVGNTAGFVAADAGGFTWQIGGVSGGFVRNPSTGEIDVTTMAFNASKVYTNASGAYSGKTGKPFACWNGAAAVAC